MLKIKQSKKKGKPQKIKKNYLYKQLVNPLAATGDTQYGPLSVTITHGTGYICVHFCK